MAAGTMVVTPGSLERLPYWCWWLGDGEEGVVLYGWLGEGAVDHMVPRRKKWKET